MEFEVLLPHSQNLWDLVSASFGQPAHWDLGICTLLFGGVGGGGGGALSVSKIL